MITFLLILVGLVALNLVLLKFSMQSVDTSKNKSKSNKVQINHIVDQAKSSEIQTAA